MEEARINSAQQAEAGAAMPPASAMHEVIISATIIRAYGTKEPLGVISRTKQPISKKLLAALKSGKKILRAG